MTREQREILRPAIDDAIYYRDPPQKCAACESSSALCAGCGAMLETCGSAGEGCTFPVTEERFSSMVRRWRAGPGR